MEKLINESKVRCVWERVFTVYVYTDVVCVRMSVCGGVHVCVCVYVCMYDYRIAVSIKTLAPFE